MNSRSKSTLEVENREGGQWFDEVRVVDSDWVEVFLKTELGDFVYRIPRRTLFNDIDQAARLPD